MSADLLDSDIITITPALENVDDDAGRYPANLIDDVRIVSLTYEGKACKWPSYTLPVANPSDTKRFDFNAYVAKKVFLLTQWCFFYGSACSNAVSQSNCNSHQTCNTYRAMINKNDVLTVFKLGLYNHLIKQEERKSKKRKTAGFGEERVTGLFMLWPIIKGNYYGCVEVFADDTGNDNHYLTLRSTCDGKNTWFKMNGCLNEPFPVEKIFKYDPSKGQILSIDGNMLNFIPYVRTVSANETLFLGTIDKRNISIVYEDETLFTFFKITVDDPTKKDFINMVKALLYGYGFNKAHITSGAENELYYLGRTSNLDLALSDYINNYAKTYETICAISNTKPKYDSIESVKLLSSCSHYAEHQVPVCLNGLTPLSFKRFVEFIVGNYNAKVVNFILHSNGESCPQFFNKIECTIVGIEEDILRQIFQSSKVEYILSTHTKSEITMI